MVYWYIQYNSSDRIAFHHNVHFGARFNVDAIPMMNSQAGILSVVAPKWIYNIYCHGLVNGNFAILQHILRQPFTAVHDAPFDRPGTIWE